MANTKITVTVEYEIEYEGTVAEEDIEVNDIIRDVNAIKSIKIKTKSVK